MGGVLRVFHYVFGQNTKESKDALIAFLNVILCKEKNPITSIEILNPINFCRILTLFCKKLAWEGFLLC